MVIQKLILNLPVLVKVSILLAVVAIFSTGFGAVLYSKNAAIERAVVEQGHILDLLESTARITKAFGDMKYWNAELASSLQDSSVDAAADAKASLFAELDKLEQLDGELTTSIRTKVNEIEELSLNALDEYIMDEKAAGNVFMGEVRDHVISVDVLLADLSSKLEAQAEDARRLALDAARTALNLSLPAILGIFTALAIAGAGLFLFVVRPIRRMTSAMLRLAQGDTTIELAGEGQTDEIGNMASAVVVFRENLIEAGRLREAQVKSEEQAEIDKKTAMNNLADNFESSVSEMVETVASSAGSMQESAHELADSARESGERASDAAQASKDSAKDIETVAVATEKLRSSIEDVSQQIASSASAAHSAGEAARESNRVIKSLGEAAHQIDNIVQIIQDIAEQTNLLALNATIEAARAGDAGRGFSVVAAEVKGLAEQTTKATQDISTQIKEIQDVAQVSVGQIGQVADSIGQIEESLASVSTAAEEQSHTTGEISESIRQAAAHSRRISDTVSQLAVSAVSSQSTLTNSHQATVEMTLQTEKLGAKVGEFVTKVRSS